MEYKPVSNKSNQSGIALFMVLAAVGVLTLLVTEFTKIANISQSIAFGGLDQLKAHYLAKGALKLSLLRLKAYGKVSQMTSLPIPLNVREMLWKFPFMYPIPTDLPGLTLSEKEAIEKFQNESSLEGSYRTAIESESSRYALNSIVPNLISPIPTPTPTTPSSNTPIPTQTPLAGPIDSQKARDGLETFIENSLSQKFLDDPDFAAQYRDLRVSQLIDVLAAWADNQYERRNSASLDPVPMKRAPFFSISELQMIPAFDEDLYRLLSKNFTTSLTPGININTVEKTALKALVPEMAKQEITDFFTYRDSSSSDNLFKDPQGFYQYLQKNTASFKNNPEALGQFQKKLADQGIMLLTSEAYFKISINAQVNHASRQIEAWVTLGPQKMLDGKPDPGLKITQMTLL